MTKPTAIVRRRCWHQGHAYLCVGAIVLVGVLACGCRRGPAATSSQPAAPDSEIVRTTPQDTVRSLLQILRAELQAIARKEKGEADRQRDRIVAQVLATDDIMGRHKKAAGRFAKDAHVVLPVLVENWAAVLSYYADGLAMEEIRLAATGRDGTSAVVEIPARGLSDEAVLRVVCVRDKDDQWHVAALDFAPRPRPMPASASADTQPASAPQP